MLKPILFAALALGPLGAIASTPKQIWDEQCASCHGLNGSGDTKEGRKRHIKDYADPKVQADFSDTGLLKDLLLGVASDDGTFRMPAFKDKLSGAEARELVALIRSFKK